MNIKKFWNADKIVSITALLVGVGSLFVIVYQTSLIRQEQHASVLPYLRINYIHPSNEELYWKIANTGLGPAIIKDVRVLHQGHAHVGNLYSFFAKNYGQYPGYVMTDDITIGDMIPAGSDERILGGDTTKSERLRRFFTNIERAITEESEEDFPVLEITYSSIYNETWVVSVASTIPQKID